MHEGEKQGDSVISTIGSFSGVASLVLAVAGNNLDRLSDLQRWGLAVASAVMLWSFLAGLVIHQFSVHSQSYRTKGKAFAAMFVGGWVGGGLLLAVLPFFSFGLAAPHVESISIWAGGSFAVLFTIGSVIYFIGSISN